MDCLFSVISVSVSVLLGCMCVEGIAVQFQRSDPAQPAFGYVLNVVLFLFFYTSLALERRYIRIRIKYIRTKAA